VTFKAAQLQLNQNAPKGYVNNLIIGVIICVIFLNSVTTDVGLDWGFIIVCISFIICNHVVLEQKSSIVGCCMKPGGKLSLVV
jgi:hypothetical protein